MRNRNILPGNPRVLPVTGNKGTARLDVLFKTGIDLSLVDERVAGKICDITVPAPAGFPKEIPVDYFPPFAATAYRTCKASIRVDGKIAIPALLHVVKNLGHDVVLGADDISGAGLTIAFGKDGMAITR
jgi:hypothetical protein